MRYIFYLFLCIAFISFNSISQDKTHILKGKITELKSGKTIPGVTLRILNTTKGTISDDNGNFYITLSEGKYNIQISCIGYYNENVSINLDHELELNVELRESYVQLQEVVVVAEDPGIGIIRRTIANKRKWMDKLKSYQFTAYTKQTLFKEDSIASITESYSKGFFRKPDGYRERVFQKRQTENIKLNQNFAQVGGILNFNEDEIKMMGYTFTGPTAQNALDDYTYKLLKTYESKGYNIYEIKLIPTSRFKPLFEGTICIADSIYAITKVEVKPNEVFKIPFIKDFNIKYIQRFNVYDTIFWMPSDISIDASLKVKIPGIKLPGIGLTQRSILYDYLINCEIPDSIFKKQRILSDTLTKKFDSLYWEKNKVLPLTQTEQRIYKTLDSTKTLEKQFRPSGALMALDNDNNMFFKYLEYLDFRFNRVEGYFLGAKYDNEKLLPFNTKFSLGLGYGFSDKNWKWNIGLSKSFNKFKNAGISIDYYKGIGFRPDENFYPPLVITYFSLIHKLDYRDYYFTEGIKLSWYQKPLDWLSYKLIYQNEKQKSLKTNTEYGLLSTEQFRMNPAISDGRMGSLCLGVNIYHNFLQKEQAFVSVRIGDEEPMLSINMTTNAKALGSDFNFTTYNLKFNYQIATFLKSLFLPPYLSVKLDAAYSTGDLPPQRLAHLESSYKYLSTNGTFKTMNIKEFAGDAYFVVHAEHNFRTLPFKLINFTFIEEEGIEFIVFGSTGKTWLKDKTRDALFESVNVTDGWFTECGFGFSKIFLFLRADFSWRLTNNNRNTFFFTFQIGNIL